MDLIILILLITSIIASGNQLMYEKGNQFPPDSEHIHLPKMALMSIHMGPLNYKYLDLTLESMRWNAEVDFFIIHVVNEALVVNDTARLLSAKPNNLKVKSVSYAEAVPISKILDILKTIRLLERINIQLFRFNFNAWV